MNWCQATIDAAREMGVEHVSVIPVRAGNGALEQLTFSGDFSPPTARMLEQILAKNLLHKDSLVTVDLWDWDKLRGTCSECSQSRKVRLAEMNLHRKVLPAIDCVCDDVSYASAAQPEISSAAPDAREVCWLGYLPVKDGASC